MSNSDLRYAAELTRAMEMLALDQRVVFIGQTAIYPGTSMSGTLAGVTSDRKIEMPVAEAAQMGMSIGLSLTGWIPVSIYTRWNFLLLSVDQLVNHLDKIPLYSGYRPKVIVRTGIGSERPMHPGLQHVGDMTEAFRSICRTVNFVRLEDPDDIVPAYRKAMERDGSTVLVEICDFYNEK